MNDTVSVIIPAYNCEETVVWAIKSAENQTLSPNEIIIIDDASNDTTSDRAKSYLTTLDSGIFLSHKQNKGQNAAQNTGLTQATGDYIAFLDADDRWDNTKLSKQIRHLKEKPSDFVACYCDVRHTDPTEDEFRNKLEQYLSTIAKSCFNTRIKEGGELVRDEILTNKFYLGGMSTLVVEHEALTDIGGFDEEIDRVTDLTFLLKLLTSGKLAYLDEQLVHKIGTNTTASDDMYKYKSDFLQVAAERVIELEFQGRDVISKHKFDIAKMHFSEGDFHKGYQLLRKSRVPLRRDYYSLFKSIIAGLKNR